MLPLPLGVHLFCMPTNSSGMNLDARGTRRVSDRDVANQNKRTKQKGSPYSPCGFPALLDLVGHDGNFLRSDSRHADPTSSAMLGFA